MNTGNLSGKQTKFDRLSLFSFLWAVATLFHMISFYDDVSLINPLTWLDGVAAVALLFYPRSVVLFLLLLCFRIGHVAEWMPFTPNHILFEFILNIGMLLALLWTLSSSSLKKVGYNFQDPEVRETLYNSFAPIARISLFILYFYAVLHKLNWDYFNPEISCSTTLMEGMIESRLPFLPNHEWIHGAAIWGTLVLEAGIPILLFFKRTRLIAILVGMGFHYFLSIHPHGGIYSFSAMLFALFSLFTSPGFPQRLNVLLHMVSNAWGKTRLLTKLVFGGAGLGLVLFIWINWQYRLDIAGFLYWSIWTMVALFVYLVIISQSPGRPEMSYRKTFGMQHAWFWVVPLVLTLNGMSPYLGLKTQTSFSMFSNLRTEGGITNHIFIPNAVRLTNWQEDLVEVVETDFEGLANLHSNDQYITFFEFRRAVSQVKGDFYIKYVRNGKLEFLKVENGVSNKPDITSPVSFLASKILYFRPIDKGPCDCKH